MSESSGSSSSSPSSSSSSLSTWIPIVGAAIAGVSIGAAAYYWRAWTYSPHVKGEELVPDEVRTAFQWYSWWGECKKDDFQRLLGEPVQRLCQKQLISAVKAIIRQMEGGAMRSSDDLSSSSLSLSISAIVQDNPWTERLGEAWTQALNQDLRIEVPPHLVERIFFLFDKNADGKVTKEEFISKYLALQTGSHEARITALFTVFDEDGDGLVSVDEVQTIVQDLALLVHEALPQMIAQVEEISVDLLMKAIYEACKTPVSRYIDETTLHDLLLGIRRSLSNDAVSGGAQAFLNVSANDEDLFEKYATVIEGKDGEDTFGINRSHFSLMIEQMINFEKIASLFDSLLVTRGTKQSPAIQKELDEFSTRMRRRLTQVVPTVADLLFNMLDLDDNGVVSRSEFDVFLNFITGRSGQVVVENLEVSMVTNYVSQPSRQAELEVKLLMHLLAKNGRVTSARLSRFLHSLFSILRMCVKEWVVAHTDEDARQGPLSRLVRAWFHTHSAGKNTMKIPAFSQLVGDRLVSVIEKTMD